LRDPHEVLLHIFSVVVNLLIIGLILAGVLLLGFLNALAGEPLSGPVVEAIRVAFVALLLLVPGLVVYRQLTHAGIRGSAVRLSRRQFPDIYSVKKAFAHRLDLRRDPEIYLMSGNGTLNAFAASTFGYDFVVIHSELFSNTYERNKEALAFIIGHELGHLRLGHTRLWYQLSTAYVDRIPLLGKFLSRAKEFSCDRHGAYLAPRGEQGLVLLAAGRYVYKEADFGELQEQAKVFRAGCRPASPVASFHGAALEGLVRCRILQSSRIAAWEGILEAAEEDHAELGEGSSGHTNPQESGARERGRGYPIPSPLYASLRRPFSNAVSGRSS
jgi:Zn-dependent protease with chaperone function